LRQPNLPGHPDILRTVETSNLRVVISATFTAEPVESVLRFWGRRLDLDVEVRFAPYNQVSQVLLDPAGDFASNHQGLNAIFARIEDLAQFDFHDPATLSRIESNLRALLDLVRAAAAHMSVPLIFVLCPSSAEFLADPVRARFVREMTKITETILDDAPGIQSLTCDEIERLYPVFEKHSPEGERLGRIPYTDLYFCALGTALVRLTHGLFMPPFKVIALDCDNTLWRGICGEDGPRGIAVDPPYRTLQQFMLQQRELGLLLTLASKNNERDVIDTFEQHPEMPLQLRHFIVSRLNWEAKAPNIESMATELSLGVESFIFVDDNPKETAELSESLPQVLSLTLPHESSAIPHFLSHIWAFDHVTVTEEDRHRNVYYAQAQEFGRELQKAQSAEHFLETLELRVRVEPLTSERLARTAQLTQRTNQFNFTTIRRTEQEIQGLVASGAMECLTVEVSDRFGDYGLTGVVLFSVQDDALNIDTFLLSCRVLGRGVEHRVMAALGEEASRLGLSFVVAKLESTSKNQPARDFLQTVGAGFLIDGVYRFPVNQLRTLKPHPTSVDVVQQASKAQPPGQTRATHKRPDYEAIALRLSTPAQIYEALQNEGREAGTTSHHPADESLTDIESQLAAIWCDLLKRPSVPLSGNFFDLGGHSLLAVVLIMRVKEAFDVELPIDDVYSAGLTLGGLARKIEAIQHGTPEEYDAILRELESLSDEEVERLLAEEDSGVV
jgi:FkbH-like protein